jgi:hypothetical protein
MGILIVNLLEYVGVFNVVNEYLNKDAGDQ